MLNLIDRCCSGLSFEFLNKEFLLIPIFTQASEQSDAEKPLVVFEEHIPLINVLEHSDDLIDFLLRFVIGLGFVRLKKNITVVGKEEGALLILIQDVRKGDLLCFL